MSVRDALINMSKMAFLETLVKDDLVAATTASSGKLHLIRIVRPVTADMCKGEPSAGALAQMFDGRPLCEVRPRFWWRPTDELESWSAENKCRWCWSKWRSSNRPFIKGYAKAEAPVASAFRLPWGWHEVTPTGHPLDLTPEAPDPDPDEDEKKVGSKRVEVRRWIRGMRYVRITQDNLDKRFCVRYGDVNDAPDEERWVTKAGWDTAILRAVTTMALGGHGGNGTTNERLTMRDIAPRS